LTCQQAEWVKANHVLGVKPPKITPNPTLPFTREEMKRILAGPRGRTSGSGAVAFKQEYANDSCRTYNKPNVSRFKSTMSGILGMARAELVSKFRDLMRFRTSNLLNAHRRISGPASAFRRA
jgi:hypothetical protein